MLTDDKDADLVAAAFRDHWAMVRATALRMTRDPEVAADIAQDAFLRLVTETKAGRVPDHVGSWLYRTSSNLVISRARHAAVARRAEPALLRQDQPAEPHAIASMRERTTDLASALSRLPEVERRALLMAAEGASGEEMTATIGRSACATRTLLCRARKRLRAGLAEIESAGVAGCAPRRGNVLGVAT
jgi:RNA polymerase sigma-70 factor (ECF subfamily)